MRRRADLRDLDSAPAPGRDYEHHPLSSANNRGEPAAPAAVAPLPRDSMRRSAAAEPGKHMSLPRRTATVRPGQPSSISTVVRRARQARQARQARDTGRVPSGEAVPSAQCPQPGMVSDSNGSGGDADWAGQTRRRRTGPSLRPGHRATSAAGRPGRECQCGGATDPRRPRLGPPTGQTAGYASPAARTRTCARCGPRHRARGWTARRVPVKRPDRGTDRLSRRSYA